MVIYAPTTSKNGDLPNNKGDLSIQKIGDLIKTNDDLRTLVIWQTDMVI